jgi:hypothetical protein
MIRVILRATPCSTIELWVNFRARRWPCHDLAAQALAGNGFFVAEDPARAGAALFGLPIFGHGPEPEAAHDEQEGADIVVEPKDYGVVGGLLMGEPGKPCGLGELPSITQARDAHGELGAVHGAP